MNILITGAYGFLGTHLSSLLEKKGHNILKFGSLNSDLDDKIKKSEAIIHLASVMRPNEKIEFEVVNVGLTKKIIESCIRNNKLIPICFTSSIKADRHSDYGLSKLRAEELLTKYHYEYNVDIKIFRLKWVFGKLSKPYNHSVVSTFIHQAITGKILTIDNPNAFIELIYVDDVVNAIASTILQKNSEIYCEVGPVVIITISELADKIVYFKNAIDIKTTPNLDNLFEKRLFDTFISYM